MSEIVEKTIASLPSILTGAKSNTASRAFQTFIKNLGSLQTKYEEEQFIQKELTIERQRLSQPSMSTSQTRECLVRLLYCHMLGYDVSFAHIAAVKLAQQGSLLDKRAGYLICGLLLRESDELVMLLVNTVQKDLRSTNILEVCVALTGAGQLMSPEMIPAILPLVQEKLKHNKEIVRRRALLCLHQLYLKAPELLQHSGPLFQQALADRDPGVMWAALQFYMDIAKTSPNSLQHLTPTLTHILGQVCSRQLSSDYDFHSVPAPWLQILLLRILAKMGQQNQQVSQQVYPVLQEVLHRTDPSHKIGLAVIYECLETILTIWPHPALVEHAAKCVGKFLASKNINLKYLGLKALALVVRINPSYAMGHQEVVIECLEHEDLTIQQRTLELLYGMTNQENVQVIVKRMIQHLERVADTYIRADLVVKVMEVAHKFSKDKCWYFDSVCQLLSLEPTTNLSSSVVDQVLEVLQEDEDNTTASKAQQHAATVAWQRVSMKKEYPLMLLQIDCLILGEYSSLCLELSPGDVICGLCELVTRHRDVTIHQCVLSALTRLALHITLEETQLEKLQTDVIQDDMEIQQQLRELTGLCLAKQNGLSVGDLAKKCAMEEMDFSLSFLDDFVSDALEAGGQPYKLVGFRQAASVTTSKDSSLQFSGLNFGPYSSPMVGSIASSSPLFSPGPASVSPGGSLSHGSDNFSGGKQKQESGLRLQGVRQVWGKEGLLKKKDSQPEIPDLQPSQVDMQPPTAPSLPPEQPASKTSVEDEESKKKEENKKLASELFRGISPPSQDPPGSQGS